MIGNLLGNSVNNPTPEEDLYGALSEEMSGQLR